MDATPPPKKPERFSRRSLLMGLGVIGLILIIFLIGRSSEWLNLEGLQGQLNDVATSPWGLPFLVLIFCVGAFLGVPQFALIGMGIFAFGPWVGFIYGWIANLASGALTYWTGRVAGAQAFRKYAGETANRFSGFVGRNAFTTSALIRIVPSGPFLMVNMAFGVSRANFSAYLAGLGLGSLPKLALVAFAGQSLFSALRGNPLLAILAGLIALGLYLLIAYYARQRIKHPRNSIAQISADMVDSSRNDAE